MTLDTETPAAERTVTTAEATPQPETSRLPATRRAVLAWAAIVAACIAVAVLAIVTLVGGEDRDSTRDRGYVGSDEHLYNQAREIEDRVSDGSDEHLYNQAREIEDRVSDGSDQHLYNQARDIEARAAE